MENVIDFAKKYFILMCMGFVGIVVLCYGLWSVLRPSQAKVEIIKGEVTSEKRQVGEIVVDVAGAVEKPGVYRLASGSRIGDVLVVAGGLSAKADREWVAKMINLAEIVKDGGKIFIPDRNENIKPINQSTNTPMVEQGKININTASLAELDRLSGIGSVRAQTIISNRPYGSVEELVTKAKIPQSVYEKIKDSISTY